MIMLPRSLDNSNYFRIRQVCVRVVAIITALVRATRYPRKKQLQFHSSPRTPGTKRMIARRERNRSLRYYFRQLSN